MNNNDVDYYVKHVQGCLYNTAAGAVKLGFYLNEVRNFKVYEKCEKYKSFEPQQYTLKSGTVKFTRYGFYEFCSDYFNLSRRSVDRYIDISLAFCHYDDGYIATYFVDSKYANYSVSALAEMLKLSDAEKNKVTSNTSINEIRALKKNNDSAALPDHEEQEDNFNEVISTKDVDFENTNLLKSYTYKKKHYDLSNEEDFFVDSMAGFTSSFKKMKDYVSKGYLVRMVLYKPGEDGKNEK